MRTVKPLAFRALVLTLCVLPRLTAEEKLDLPGNLPSVSSSAIPPIEPLVDTSGYPWDTPLEAGMRAQLLSIAPPTRFEEIPFEECIDYLRELARLNIVVNWSALEAAAIERDREVTLHLSDVTLETVLRQILKYVGGGEVDLDYSISNGVLTISTREDLARDVKTVFYNVADLVRAANIRNGGGDCFLRLVAILQTTIDPESWREAGGNTGAISDFSDILVIVQTPRTHEEIWDFLQGLRSQMGLLPQANTLVSVSRPKTSECRSLVYC